MPIKPIKAQDITDEIANRFTEVMRCHYGSYSLDTKPNTICDIANALIEAGIVSPPVWVIKEDGVIVSGCFSSHKKAVAYRDSLWRTETLTVEHWKGQAE